MEFPQNEQTVTNYLLTSKQDNSNVSSRELTIESIMRLQKLSFKSSFAYLHNTINNCPASYTILSNNKLINIVDNEQPFKHNIRIYLQYNKKGCIFV